MGPGQSIDHLPGMGVVVIVIMRRGGRVFFVHRRQILCQGLFQVCQNVVNILNAYAQAYQIRRTPQASNCSSVSWR